MSTQPNFYAIIPANVRYDAGLNANAKLLYGEITALCGQEGFCWAENGYFAALYDVNTETVSRWISQLRDKGYVDVEIQKSAGNTRKISIAKKVNTYCQKTQEVLSKNAIPLAKKRKSNKESITINNTINRERSALAFLASEYPSDYERFLMQYKTRLGAGFEDFEKAFNNQVDIEIEGNKLTWTRKALFARADNYATNWIKNDKSGAAKSFQQNNSPSPASNRLEIKKRA